MGLNPRPFKLITLLTVRIRVSNHWLLLAIGTPNASSNPHNTIKIENAKHLQSTSQKEIEIIDIKEKVENNKKWIGGKIITKNRKQ